MSDKEQTKGKKEVQEPVYTGGSYVPGSLSARENAGRTSRRGEELKRQQNSGRTERRGEELKRQQNASHTGRRSEELKRQQNAGRPKRRSEELREQEEQKRLSEARKPEKVTKHSGKIQKPGRKAENFNGERKTERKIGRLTGEKKVRKGINKKKLFLGIGGGIIAAAYIGAAVYFGGHFYSGTVIYGIDCSQMTVQEVKEEVSRKLGEYQLNIAAREGRQETITAEQIDLKFEDNGAIEALMTAQRCYIWPIMTLMSKAQGEQVSFTFDRSQAEFTINNLNCTDSIRMVAPHDAYIQATDTGFEVAPEVMGTTLDTEKTREIILAALDRGETELSLEDEDCYINPEVYQNDEQLQKDASEMSELARASITLDFGQEQELIDASKIREWIVKTKNGNFVIDDAKVTDYVEALAARYDTFGLPVEFYTSIGTVETLSGGDYGWCMDQDGTVVAILKALEDGYRGTMEPVYVYEGMSHENNGIGYTYVEICISLQKMWCYEDGNLIVETDVVTGNPNKGNATPSGGVWAIDAKERNATLRGEGYAAPVDYWMPFNGDVGIHDLQSRAYFGGDIYLYGGSHGCVNTPYEAVKEIYNTVSIGTPVIVYD